MDPKRKAYINVFWGLCFLTVLELAFLQLPWSQSVITILVCLASLAKAVVVGWVYMHLNHETKGLKVVLLFPLFVAFFYAVFLIYDSKVTETRHTDPYVGQPERQFGQRKLHDRVVDDFGNTVVVAPPAAGAQHGASSEAAHGAAKSEGDSASASTEGVAEQTDAPAAGVGNTSSAASEKK